MKNLKLSSAMLQKSGIIFLAVYTIFAVSSCKDDDDGSPIDNGDGISLSEVIEAMGSTEVLEGIKTISYTAKGNSYEYEQDIPHLPSPLTSNYYEYDFYTELNQRKIRMDYDSIYFNHPAPYNTRGPLLIINGKEGSISKDFSWRSYYFGVTDPRGVYATEIEFNLKNQKMANPIELLKEVLNTGGPEQNTINDSYRIPTRVANLDIELVIDSRTKMPQKSRIVEADFLKGDVFFEVYYKDWVEVGGTMYPSTLDYMLDNELFKRERLTNIAVNPELAADTFTPEAFPPEKQIAYNEEQASFAIYHTQFYHRWNAWNIGWPEPVNDGALDLGSFDVSQFGLASQFVGEKVKIMGRPDNRLWNVAIKTSDCVVIVDAPLNQKWTRSLINGTKNAFPGEEIKAVIATHHHHDHFAGIREAAYETGKIYIAEESVGRVNQVLNSSHTLLPDNLANNPRNVDVESVSDVTYLDNGAIEIHRLKPTNTSAVPHSDDMLVVYIPEYEVLIQSDQYWNGTFTQVWNGFAFRPFTQEARPEIINNAKYLLDYIQEKELKVSKIIATHGGLGPISDLELTANAAQ